MGCAVVGVLIGLGVLTGVGVGAGLVTHAQYFDRTSAGTGTGTGVRVPGAPVVSAVTAGEGSLTVAWSAPVDGGGAPVSGYDLRHITTAATDKSDAKWVVLDDVGASGVLAFTVTGLVGGVSYDVQVRAVNAGGDGAWSATTTGAPTTGSPVIDSVVAGDAALTVVWDAPAGVPAGGITAYDLRYKATSAGSWTVLDSVWTPGGDVWTPGGDGRLSYVLSGLTNSTSYDVQVRAVTTADGAWSDTETGTPAEHGGTASAASTLTAGVPLGGVLQSSSDKDFFKVTLAAATQLVLRTSGATDTEATLYNSSSIALGVSNDDSHMNSGGNFLIAGVFAAGVYYVEVTGSGSATGSYAMHFETITDTTGASGTTDSSGTTDAHALYPGGEAHGVVYDYNDTDYFTFDLAETTDVVIRMAAGPLHVTNPTGSGIARTLLLRDASAVVKNSSGTVVAGSTAGFMLPEESHPVIREQLSAGSYRVEVKPASSYHKGFYTLRFESVIEPGSTTATAAALGVGDIRGGNISSATDTDYFKLTFATSTEVLLRAVSLGTDIDAAVLDSNSNTVSVTMSDETFDSSAKAYGFTDPPHVPGGHVLREDHPVGWRCAGPIHDPGGRPSRLPRSARGSHAHRGRRLARSSVDRAVQRRRLGGDRL